MEVRELTCICCPLGCNMTVSIENGIPVSVTGNTCKRGEIYAKKEVTNPTRIVTSTVRLGDGRMVPVKTASDIPKGKIMDCIRQLKEVSLDAPVASGQVILENAADTGVAVVATKEILLNECYRGDKEA